jgi:2-methylcitrate dehydratase PrpD
MKSVLDMVTSHLAETNYEALPADAILETKKQILDTLGVIISGSTCNISGEMDALVDLVREWGGKEESTIIAFGGKVPAINAAFVNGTLCVRRDFDDTNLMYIGGHTSRSIVPTAIAMAERQGNINGKELIAAAALGHDLECRVALAAQHSSSWYMATNFFGAAATAGKILGFNDEKMRYTLAFAFHQVCGASGGGGSAGLGRIKGISNGFTAKAGIVSALLAERGFTVDWDMLEPKNKRNFFEVFFGGSYLPVALTTDLGKIFLSSSTSQKAFPCCHGQHTSLKATLALIKEHHIKPDDVAEVTLHLSSANYSLLADPVEKKQDPQNIIQTQFSLCWGVASAIVYGDVGIRNFTEEALRDARIREMAYKVFGKPDMGLSKQPSAIPAVPVIVKIKTKHGKEYSKQVDYPFGSPEDPMSLTDVAEKFRHCCQYSVKPIPEENQDKVIRMVERLEEVSDVSQIVRLIA